MTVLEASEQVGGLARTEVRDGYRFDLGGHRFFTKSPEVEALWLELLGSELLLRPRLSRIYWRGRLIEYPLRAGDVVARSARSRSLRSAASYAAARLRPRREAETFEQWVTQRFGRRLFELFFRSYTEKVWGVPTLGDPGRVGGAADPRPVAVARRAGRARASAAREVRSLIEEFHYPRLGPGQMWERMADEIVGAGGEVALESPVTAIRLAAGGAVEVEAGGEIAARPTRRSPRCPCARSPGWSSRAPRGRCSRRPPGCATATSSASPWCSTDRTRSPTTGSTSTTPRSAVGRIQNFRAWSPDLVPDPDRTCLGLEYFCFEGDELWDATDAELVARAIGGARDARARASATAVVAGHVVRVPEGLPDLRLRVRARGSRPCAAGSTGSTGCVQVGRNGLHRYNNSDHSMLTAMRAVENLCDGAAPRHLGGERRQRLPRGGRGRRAALPRGAGDPGDGATPLARRGRRRQEIS